MAHAFGLRWWGDVMGWPGPPTELALRVLDRWLDDDYNRPSRADFYAMRLAQAVEVGQLKSPSRDLKDRLVKFPDRTARTEESAKGYPPGIRPLTKEDIRRLQSEMMRTRAGGNMAAVKDPSKWEGLARQGIAVPTVIRRDGTVEGPNYPDAPVRSRADVRVIT